MRIRILKDVPVPDQHGVKRGKVFDATAIPGRDGKTRRGHLPRVVIVGDAGDHIALYRHEYEIIGEKNYGSETNAERV